ncbi:MAG: hypothetical protein ABIN67_24985 [Ferruginibacter sp.]
MRSRRRSPELLKLQIDFRLLLQTSLEDFNIHSIQKVLENKTELIAIASKLDEFPVGEIDHLFFKGLSYTVNAFYLLLEFYNNRLLAINGADILKSASEMNVDLLSDILKDLDKDRPSIKGLILLRDSLINVKQLNDLQVLAEEFSKISLPMMLTAEFNPYARARENNDPKEETTDGDIGIDNTLISVVFYMDRELWANPQIIKPQHLYSLHGIVKINEWPKGYEELVLSQVSTTNDEWFTLSLPIIKFTKDKEIFIDGNITLQNSQSMLEAPIAIKLLAQFKGSNIKPFYPPIIGYDQLILRVIDKNSFVYPTGYNKLNEKVLEIVLKIQNDIPDIPKEELENFIVLLSAILNYQGYCYQQAIYKDQSNISEDKFRDTLIQYLSARPELASSLVKEGVIAGGRVEINYKGIVAELKVEKKIADRKKIIEKYQKQPSAYASATAAQLSILCVLELTPKVSPPAIAAKNIFFHTPVLHGFENIQSSSKIVIIIIDGNTPNPSSYR